jgi:hypothetical protein
MPSFQNVVNFRCQVFSGVCKCRNVGEIQNNMLKFPLVVNPVASDPKEGLVVDIRCPRIDRNGYLKEPVQ